VIVAAEAEPAMEIAASAAMEVVLFFIRVVWFGLVESDSGDSGHGPSWGSALPAVIGRGPG
jgi:hypothetical protein